MNCPACGKAVSVLLNSSLTASQIVKWSLVGLVALGCILALIQHSGKIGDSTAEWNQDPKRIVSPAPDDSDDLHVPMPGTIKTATDDNFICATMGDFERMEKLVQAGDNDGLTLMMLNGGIGVLRRGTRVRVIECHFGFWRAATGHRGHPTEVRVLATGQSGYVDSYFLGP